jgi:hypothetical protein
VPFLEDLVNRAKLRGVDDCDLPGIFDKQPRVVVRKARDPFNLQSAHSGANTRFDSFKIDRMTFSNIVPKTTLNNDEDDDDDADYYYVDAVDNGDGDDEDVGGGYYDDDAE